MFKRKNKEKKYNMEDSYTTANLVVANLEYVSSEATPYGPMVETTSQKYLFEVIETHGTIKYRELFTGYTTEDECHYFDVPYVANIKPLKEVVPTVAKKLHRYGLLLLLNEINTPQKVKIKERTN